MKTRCEFNGLGKKSKPVVEVHKLFSFVSSISARRGEGGWGGSLTTGFKGHLLLCRLRALSELPKVHPAHRVPMWGDMAAIQGQWTGPAQEGSGRFAWGRLPMISRKP